VLGPGRDDGHITAFLLDPEPGLLTLVAECTGTTYGGLIEHEGQLWVSHVETRRRELVEKPGDERVVCLAGIAIP
jgi:hypothetical protein